MAQQISTRNSTKTPATTVDTSGLNQVLAINKAANTVLVEPNVSMQALVDATLPHGYVPPVVMEFPSITVGGGFSGTSGESSSYRHGFFDRTVNWIEIILGNGEIVHASPETRDDLFFGAAASFGTLGITTLLELQLVPVPPNPVVQLTYMPFCTGVEEAVRIIEQTTSDPTYDYVDGIMFSKDQGVICAGSITTFEHGASHKLQRFSRSTDPWFYMHVEERCTGVSDIQVDLIPLVDYLFRYDRGGFWVGKYAFQYFLLPQTKLTRWALDDIAHTQAMYHAVHKSGLFAEYTIQDVAVPYVEGKELVDFLDCSFGLYPPWLCPVRSKTSHVSGLVASRQSPANDDTGDSGMMLSVGVWGPGPQGKQPFLEFNRGLENLVHRLGGQKWLYARTYYSEDEFWDIYDRPALDELRTKYHASHLPNLYQKVRAIPTSGLTDVARKNIPWTSRLLERIWKQWPICGLYGMFHTFYHKEYLLKNVNK